MRLRESVRALVIDPQNHVLLVHFDWESLKLADGLWATPGGGVEPGESRLEAIQRELREETGLAVDSLGPELWTKTALFPMTSWDGQIDRTYLFRTQRFDPAPEMSKSQLAAENIHEIRWWTPAELNSGEADFAPRSLPELLSKLHHEGIPATPIETDGF